MSLVRRLFPELRHVMRQMDEAFAPFQRALPRWPGVATPIADIHETDQHYIVETELPGVPKEKVSFELPDEHTLIVKAQVQRTKNGSNDHEGDGERYYGRMERAFNLPTRIEPDKIQAELKDGILKVEIPKIMPERKPLQINWK